MTFKVEDGTGVEGANSYVTPQFITDYLTDRGRSTENGWDTLASPAQEAAAIAGTDYIEQRWAERFLGRKEFLDVSTARGTLTLTAQAADGETVTLGSTTYTFNTVLGAANSVLIGASTSASIDNLVSAVAAVGADAGVKFGVGTVQNADATASASLNDTMLAEAVQKGTPGNDVVTTTTLVAGVWTGPTLTGGGDVQVPQPLSFPRVNLIDRDGVLVSGIPTKLQQAAAEYSVRAATATLLPDPVVDPTGHSVASKSVKVGPIETATTYSDGASPSQTLRPYPAADRMLSGYVAQGGRVFRG